MSKDGQMPSLKQRLQMGVYFSIENIIGGVLAVHLIESVPPVGTYK